MSLPKTRLGKALASHTTAAFFTIAFVVPLGWMALDRDPPYEFKQVEIIPPIVEQGSAIRIFFTVDHKRTTCGPGLVYREFKEANGKLHVFDPIQRAAMPRSDMFTRMATVPEAVSPGVTEYRGMACYSCNPLQSWLRWPVCVSTPAVKFTVLKKET